MLVKIGVDCEFAAGLNLVQTTVSERDIGYKAFDAGNLLKKVNKGAGMDRAEIKLCRTAEAGIWLSVFPFVYSVVTPPVFPL